MKNIKNVLKLHMMICLLLATGCASMKRLEKAVFRDSNLSNLNPAPESMSPPKLVSGAQIIDPTYNRTQADYHYTLAEAMSMDGHTQRAIEEFKLTLIYDPNSSIVRLRLSAEYLKLGLLSEAIEQSEMAVELDPSTFDGRVLLGGLYSTLKMHDLAMKQYNYLAIQYPENLEIPIYKGALFAEQKRFAEAEEVFINLAKHPQNTTPAKAYYYLGRVQSQQEGEVASKKALQSFMQSVSLDPENEDYVMALAKHYEKRQQSAQAFQILSSYQDKFGPKKSISRTLSVMHLENEDYAKALKELEVLESFEPDNLNVKVKIALILIEQKIYNEAIIKLEEIIRMAPESDKIRFYLGAVYEEIKNYKQAHYHFSQITASSSYFSESAVHASYLNKLMGDFDEALKTIENAIKQKDDVSQFYSFYASLLDETKQYDKALKMLEQAVVKFPENAQLQFFLGSMWDRKGHKSNTMLHMRKVLQIDENHVQALNFLAYTISEDGGDLDEAERLANKALDINPDDGYILDTVGWIKYKRGQLAEAIKYLEAAYKNVSDESIIAEHLGDAYFRSQLVEQAKKMYLKAVSVAEDENRIREIRTKIITIDKQQDLRKPASDNQN